MIHREMIETKNIVISIYANIVNNKHQSKKNIVSREIH